MISGRNGADRSLEASLCRCAPIDGRDKRNAQAAERRKPDLRHSRMTVNATGAQNATGFSSDGAVRRATAPVRVSAGRHHAGAVWITAYRRPAAGREGLDETRQGAYAASFVALGTGDHRPPRWRGVGPRTSDAP